MPGYGCRCLARLLRRRKQKKIWKKKTKHACFRKPMKCCSIIEVEKQSTAAVLCHGGCGPREFSQSKLICLFTRLNTNHGLCLLFFRLAHVLRYPLGRTQWRVWLSGIQLCARVNILAEASFFFLFVGALTGSLDDALAASGRSQQTQHRRHARFQTGLAYYFLSPLYNDGKVPWLVRKALRETGNS